MFKVSLGLSKAIPAALFAGIAIAGFSAATVPVAAGETVSQLSRGGLLYDKWYKIVGVEVDETHPSYPSDAKKAGADTWRCKECHGWDYKGADGAYSSGSHATGIKGINGMAGADPADIVAVLKDDTHAFGDMMSDDNYQDLAMFVSKGQIDTDQYIDRETKLPKGGDADRGAAIYNTVCAKCHREDGSRPKDMEKTLGKQMGNPWEVMHKIMNGHPGQPMPSMRAFGPQVAVDVMTHLLTLPKEK
ncbi:MAG: c-type cytochrome [Paracoccaceae bacterium]